MTDCPRRAVHTCCGSKPPTLRARSRSPTMDQNWLANRWRGRHTSNRWCGTTSGSATTGATRSRAGTPTKMANLRCRSLKVTTNCASKRLRGTRTAPSTCMLSRHRWPASVAQSRTLTRVWAAPVRCALLRTGRAPPPKRSMSRWPRPMCPV